MAASRRATLLHNPSAGDARPTADDLKAILREAGFQVRYRSTKKEWKKVLEWPSDVIVVAGGDGTVAKVCRQLAGSPVPLALLPAGTANNIARTLGIVGDARQLAAEWLDSPARALDLAVISAPWTEQRFVEAAGGGALAAAVIHGHEQVEDASALVGGEMDRAMLLVRRLLEEARPERWGIELDGEDLSGDYVAVEAMNIRFVGPSLPLAPAADPGDGRLDVVLIGESDRESLLDHLSRRLEDASAAAPSLPVRQGRHIRLQPPPNVVMHADDEPLRPPDGTEAGAFTFDIVVKPAALQVLGWGA